MDEVERLLNEIAAPDWRDATERRRLACKLIAAVEERQRAALLTSSAVEAGAQQAYETANVEAGLRNNWETAPENRPLFRTIARACIDAALAVGGSDES